jgi:hypothetical protein
MTALDIFAWIVLIVLLVSALAIWVILARLPGRIARSRNHPQAEAIGVAGWLGAVIGVIWPFALIWAFLRSDAPLGAPRGHGDAGGAP